MIKKTIQILATVPFLHLSLEAGDRDFEQPTPSSAVHATPADEPNSNPMKTLLSTKAFSTDLTKEHRKAMHRATIGFSDLNIASFAAALNRNEQQIFGTMRDGWEIANITIALSVFSGLQIDQIAHELTENMSLFEKIKTIKRFERELARSTR